jgi:polysaccharide biosynthesis transport protein
MNLPQNEYSLLYPRANKEIVRYSPSISNEQEHEDVVSFSHYFWLLKRYRWKILAVVVISTTITALTCSLITPLYESTVQIVIDNKLPSRALGQDASSAPGSTDIDQMMNTEIQVVQSDAVLRPVAEQYKLLDPARSTFNNKNLKDAPVAIKNLTVSRVPNSLVIKINYRSVDPRRAAVIANSIAQSYISKELEMRARSSMGLSNFMEKQIAELKNNMDASERALAGFEQQLGFVNQDEKTNILSARLLQLNTEYSEAENDRIRKEAGFRAIDSGSIAALEVSPQAEALAKLQERIRTAREKMVDTKTIYGPNYPEYKRAANELDELTTQYKQMRADAVQRIIAEYQQAKHREAILQASLAHAKDESDRINANSLQYQQLKQEAEANKALYEELFRKIKEAGINAGFQGSAIRIADEARPGQRPIFPNVKVFTFLGFLFSLAGSVAFVVLSDVFDRTIRDPDQARQFLSTDVIGILPDVRRFASSPRVRLLSNGDSEETNGAVRLKDPFRSAGFYNEAICTLRSTIMLDRLARTLRSIMVTSAAPGEGKSTCAAHLAMAHAAQGRKTLLIDADLRCPCQHQLFGLANDCGLANAVFNELDFSELPRQVNENLYVIPAGNCKSRSFELVGPRLAELMKEIGNEYDLVIIDAPPMVGLAEPIQIAGIADGVLVIARAGSTSRQAIANLLSTLNRLHANVLAVVLNRVRLDMSPNYGKVKDYYRYVAKVVPKAS